ncbi:MAG: hypothetical protein QOF30_990, partial [Acidimicrobiaceae bacterium]|nr:hypothetical protein [Acidimicrobiaceae bacterium]
SMRDELVELCGASVYQLVAGYLDARVGNSRGARSGPGPGAGAGSGAVSGSGSVGLPLPHPAVRRADSP